MSDNLLDSYLVKLSSSVDTASFAKFNNTLSDSAKQFDGFSLKTVASFAKIDLAIVGMFASVGAGLIGLADKTAMQDQQFRLLGMRMMMGKDAARAMSLATDELGASLEEIAFDPELNRRFQALYEQNIKLGKSLGGGFDHNMMSIRDLRMEYKRFETELEFLSMGAVSKLFEKLGFGTGETLNKLDDLNDWFTTKLPTIEDEISTGLVPAWHEAVAVTKDFGKAVLGAGGEFAYLTNQLLGDGSVKSTTLSISSAAKATQDWVDVLADLAMGLQFNFRVAMHFGSVLGDMALAVKAYREGGDEKTLNALKFDIQKEFAAGTADIRDFTRAPNWRSAAKVNPDFEGLGALDDELRNRGKDSTSSSVAANGSLSSMAAMLARKISDDTGIPANLIYAQWMHETGKFTNRGATELNNFAGIKIPGTEEYKRFGSLDSFASAYEGVLESFRYTSQGINQARTPEAFAHSLKMGGYYADSEANYASQIRDFQSAYKTASDVNIQSITINVPAGTQPEDMKHVISDAMSEYTKKQTRNTMALTAGGAYH